MADETPSTNPKEETGTPRWVLIGGIIAAVLVLLLAVMMLVGGGAGGHGPGRHTPGSDTTTGHTGPRAGLTHEQP